MGNGGSGRLAKNHIYLLNTAGRVIGWPAGDGAPNDQEKSGWHLSRFYAPEACAEGRAERDLQRAWEGGLEIEAWRHREDGSRFWASVVMTPLEDQAGQPIGVVLVLMDRSDTSRGNGPHLATLPTKFDRRKR